MSLRTVQNTVYMVAGAAGGAATALACWRLGRAWLRDHESLQRENYAGRQVAVAGGIVIAVATIAVLAVTAEVRLVLDNAARLRLTMFDLPVASLVTGFALLGLVDDLLGDTGSRGFKGHVRALADGRLTTGMLKLAGGTAIALLSLSAHTRSWAWLLVDAALVALSANLANLLDRAPGRLLKASVVAGVPLLAYGWGTAEAAAAAPVFGAAWAMLPADLSERTMLGDTGANVVGAVLGYLAVELSGTTTRLVLLAVVFALNVVAEFVSFSKVIEAVPTLRWIDRLGTRR